MKVFFFLPMVFLLSDAGKFQVHVAGKMDRIMRQGDLTASIALDTLQHYKNLYGLGPVAGLKGEIAIIDGSYYRSYVYNGEIITTQTRALKAAMLVYADIKEWSAPKTLDTAVNSLADLEQVIYASAKEHGLDVRKSFPFLIKLKRGSIHFHVIDWQEGTVHTQANHKQFAVSGERKNEETVVIGFYSATPGTFTTHNSNIHMHFINGSKTLAAHVDDVLFEEGFSLQFPM